MESVLARQYVLNGVGKPIGVILPMDEYETLVRLQSRPARRRRAENQPAARSLYGALRHLGGKVAPTDELDAALREMWAAW